MNGMLLFALAAAAQATSLTQFDPLNQVRIEQRLGAHLPLDARFLDESGAEVRLGSFFGERPVVLALVYYECPMLCTQVLNGLTSSLRALKFNVGQEFDVVAISFDHKETPGLARDKKARTGSPRLVLLDAPGRPRWGVEVPEADLRRALGELIA